MMRNSKTRGVLKLAAILIGVLLLSLTMMVAPAKAFTAKAHCEAFLGGVWGGSTPNEYWGLCLNIQSSLVDSTCGPGWYADKTYAGAGWRWFFPRSCHEFPTLLPPPSTTTTTINYGMKRKGLCKLMDIEDASLGGTVTATIKGSPSALKLKADGKTYSLPVVPGSVVANGDGTYTAQFYTMDPVTGQALVPAGDYSVRCHGGSGSNDGSGNEVTIGY